ncbi:MAG: hypothetical protein GF364_05815, partial [Candidatus Lokiarchaeota archaeon]|nr:hypothetical protein [Candidatus Lokiarchaeota archaeon]
MLFDENEFESPTIKKNLKKINQYHKKDKTDKFLSQIQKLEKYLKDPNSEECKETVYIFSLLIEDYPDIMSKKASKYIYDLLKSEEDETRLNAIILYGSELIDKIEGEADIEGEDIDKFLDIALNEEIPQVQWNAFFFIEQFPEEYLDYLLPKMNQMLDLLEETEMISTVDSILNIITKIWETSLDIKLSIFNRLKDIYAKTLNEEKEIKIADKITQIVPVLNDYLKENPNATKEKILDIIEKRKPMVKIYDIRQIAQDENMKMKEVEKKFLSIKGDSEIFRFEFKGKKKYYVEIELKPLLKLLKNKKVIVDDLIPIFGDTALDYIALLTLLIKKLVKAKEIKGYLTKSYFYSYGHLKESMMNDIRQTGRINIDDYAKHINYNFILSIVQDINRETKFTGVFNKNRSVFMTLSTVIDKIEKHCIKESMFDLSNYQQIYAEDDYRMIEDECKKKFFTEYRDGSNWLTNIGYTKISNQFRQGGTVGFVNLVKISDNVNIPFNIAREIMEEWIETKPGIWDNSGKIYYLMKYVKSKVKSLDKAAKEEEIKS